MRWVKPPAFFAERFVRSAAQGTFRNGFDADNMMVALLGTSPAYLRFLALKGFVISYFLAVITLVGAVLALENRC